MTPDQEIENRREFGQEIARELYRIYRLADERARSGNIFMILQFCDMDSILRSEDHTFIAGKIMDFYENPFLSLHPLPALAKRVQPFMPGDKMQEDVKSAMMEELVHVRKQIAAR